MAYLDKIRVDNVDYDIGNNIEETLPVGTRVEFNGNVQDIPDGWKQVEDKGEIYSETETRIGTWVDGKPLYRQVVFVSSSINANTEAASSTSIQNVDNVIKLYGFCIWGVSSSNFNFPIPYISKENNQRVQIFFNDNKVKVGTNMAITNVYSIIEYTKTTDTGNGGNV